MKVTFECNNLPDFLELKSLLNTLYPAKSLISITTKIDDLDLTIRTKNILKVNGINTLDDLLQYRPNDILKFPHMGRKGFNELNETIAKHGHTLKAN